jgi:hypothetical protein
MKTRSTAGVLWLVSVSTGGRLACTPAISSIILPLFLSLSHSFCSSVFLSRAKRQGSREEEAVRRISVEEGRWPGL